MNGRGARIGITALCIAISAYMIGAVLVPLSQPAPSSSESCSVNVIVEEKSTFNLVAAELRLYSDHSYISNQYCVVKTVNGVYVSFNRDKVLRVTFNTLLDNGDVIRIYARYGTTPLIKAVLIENTNWGVVGGGDVYAMWGYYDLVITDLDAPRSSFDIALYHDTPSSNSIRIDMVGCVPSEKAWHDDETGYEVSEYTVIVNYMVTTSGTIDTSEVYLDLTFTQTIVDRSDSSTIVTTMVEKATVHVLTTGEWHTFTTNSIPIIPHDTAMTDQITVLIDVEGTAYGLVTGTSDWLTIERSFNSVREVNFSWL